MKDIHASQMHLVERKIGVQGSCRVKLAKTTCKCIANTTFKHIIKALNCILHVVKKCSWVSEMCLHFHSLKKILNLLKWFTNIKILGICTCHLYLCNMDFDVLCWKSYFFKIGNILHNLRWQWLILSFEHPSVLLFYFCTQNTGLLWFRYSLIFTSLFTIYINVHINFKKEQQWCSG